MAQIGGDGQPDQRQVRAPRWPEPCMDAGADHCWSAQG